MFITTIREIINSWNVNPEDAERVSKEILNTFSTDIALLPGKTILEERIVAACSAPYNGAVDCAISAGRGFAEAGARQEMVEVITPIVRRALGNGSLTLFGRSFC